MSLNLVLEPSGALSAVPGHVQILHHVLHVVPARHLLFLKCTLSLIGPHSSDAIRYCRDDTQVYLGLNQSDHDLVPLVGVAVQDLASGIQMKIHNNDSYGSGIELNNFMVIKPDCSVAPSMSSTFFVPSGKGCTLT